MVKALISLHFQNDICHRDGRVPFSLDRGAEDPVRFLESSRALIAAARESGWLVVHVHIAFQPDFSDLPRNCRLFRAVEERGAVQRGSWGASPFEGFEPEAGDVTLVHGCNNAFQGTGLDAILREKGVNTVCVIGLATQFSVEHTVRQAADLGYVVTVARDCCASADKDAQAASFKTMAFLADVVESSAIAF